MDFLPFEGKKAIISNNHPRVNYMFKRLLHIDKNHPKSFFLFGPRGTGKTSWVRMQFPEALYIDLLKNQDYMLLQNNPSRLEKLVLAHNSPWTVIDEVQKIPELLDEVHRLIETHKKYFVLTGSSSRKLKQKGVNLLAGRALTYHMHPLTCFEMGAAFNIKDALRYGLLPSIHTEQDPRAFLESYITTYLREEVLQEGLVRHAGSFTRFMEIASFSQGSQLNLANIAREVGVSRKIVETYFDILSDLLIADQIPCFTKRAQRKLSQHPKFYYFDVGVYKQLRPKGFLDSPEEIGGIAFETLFYQHIKACIHYYKLDLTLYFWRTATGVEVDFIIYGENGLFAFELKSRSSFSTKDLSGLRAFKKDYPTANCYLIYTGEHTEKYDDVWVLPVEQALMRLPELLLDDI